MCCGLCRVRFLLDGIYLEFPGRSLETVYQPIALVPPVVSKKQGTDPGVSTIAVEQQLLNDALSGKRRRNARKATERAACVSASSSSSSLSSNDGRYRKVVEKGVTNKRPKTKKSASSSGDGPAANKTNIKSEDTTSSTQAKPAPQSKPKNKSSKHASASPKKQQQLQPSKTEPTSGENSLVKKVRFADMVEKKEMPEDAAGSSSSSNSSYDSYTDPPLPTQPVNIVDDDVHRLCVMRASQNPEQVMQNAEQDASDTATDLAASLAYDEPPDQQAAVNTEPKDPQTENDQPSSDSRGRSTASGSWTSTDLESNVDYTSEDFAASRFHRQQALSPHGSDRTIRHRKLRQKATIPDPVFIVRSRVYPTSNGTTSSGLGLRKQNESDDSLRDRYAGKKTSSADVSRKSALKKSSGGKRKHYGAPSVSDDVDEDVQLDHLGTLFRDV